MNILMHVCDVWICGACCGVIHVCNHAFSCLLIETPRTQSHAIAICSTIKSQAICDRPLWLREIKVMGKRFRLNRKQPVVSKSSSRAEKLGISTNTFRRLYANGWPIVLFNLLFMMQTLGGPFMPESDCIEFFSGVANVVKAFKGHGFTAHEFDIINHADYQSLVTPNGFLVALCLSLSLRKMGMAHWATVCSTWIFLSRSSVCRSEAMPYGDQSKRCVKEANIMVGRMAAIMMLLGAKKCTWILEQPRTSIMDKCEVLEFLQRSHMGLQVLKFNIHMGCFGAPTLKPTWLLSNRLWPKGLERRLTRKQRKQLNSEDVVIKDNDGKVAGGSGLKETQAYTPEYGIAVFDQWHQSVEECGDMLQDDSSDSTGSIDEHSYQESDLGIADLDSVAAFFGISTTVWFDKS